MMAEHQILRLTGIFESTAISPRSEDHKTVGAHDLIDHTQLDGQFLGLRQLRYRTPGIVKNIVSDLRRERTIFSRL